MGVYYFVMLIGFHGLGFSYLYPAIKNGLNDWEGGERESWENWVVWFRVMLFVMMVVGLIGMYSVSSKSGF